MPSGATQGAMPPSHYRERGASSWHQTSNVTNSRRWPRVLARLLQFPSPPKTALLERVLDRTTLTPAFFLFKSHYSQPKSQSESNTHHVTSFMSGEVTIKRHCWHSRGAFLKVLTSLDQWCIATDNEIQAIQAMVAMQKVPSKRGTRTLGLVNGVWVSDEGIFDASGWIEEPELVYLPMSGESPLAGRLRYRVPNPSARVSVAQAVYEQVWKLNELTVIGALIGWFFSTPFKPYIQRQLNHFPILNVWGTMGAGKTSLLRVFWKLFGVDSELLACTDTEFSTFHRI
jgi:hypothetical protein